MSKRKIVDIEYATGYLSFSRVREGVLKNREELEKRGYKCSWKTDLDLDKKLDPLVLKQNGYFDLENCVIASFNKSGLPFCITIYPKSKRAKIHGHGDNHVYLDEFEATKKEFDQFKDLTGILIEPKISSEPH